MKKCPFCAEEIQEEAIFCRYCRRDLPQGVKKELSPSLSRDNVQKSWRELQDYQPPENDIDKIYQRKLSKLKQGDWKNLAHPPMHGYMSRHYGGKVSLQEFFALKTSLLEQAWSNSNSKSPSEIARFLSLNPPKFKGSLFSTKNKWMEVAASDAISALQLSLLATILKRQSK